MCYYAGMNVGIYGLGRFGSFWGTELSRFVTVKGFNRSPLISVPKGVELVSEEELLQCDTIVLCVAISALESVLTSISSRVQPETLVMDTCSVKVYPARIMQTVLPKSINIIATHPMFGPDSGKAGITGLPLVFSPIRATIKQELVWKDLFHAMQLQVIEMDCDQHDREAAYSQGVTHFVGRVLDELQLQPTQLATVGYQRLLSIVEQTCNDPLQLFYDLQRYNPYAHAMQQRLKEALDAVLGVLTDHDSVPRERV